jgi:hypothetical protein
MQYRVCAVRLFFSCFILTRGSKRGVAELAQSLAVFTSLRVLEIRENPGVGGRVFVFSVFLSF